MRGGGGGGLLEFGVSGLSEGIPLRYHVPRATGFVVGIKGLGLALHCLTGMSADYTLLDK